MSSSLAHVMGQCHTHHNIKSPQSTTTSILEGHRPQPSALACNALNSESLSQGSCRPFLQRSGRPVPQGASMLAAPLLWCDSQRPGILQIASHCTGGAQPPPHVQQAQAAESAHRRPRYLAACNCRSICSPGKQRILESSFFLGHVRTLDGRSCSAPQGPLGHLQPRQQGAPGNLCTPILQCICQSQSACITTPMPMQMQGSSDMHSHDGVTGQVHMYFSDTCNMGLVSAASMVAIGCWHDHVQRDKRLQRTCADGSPSCQGTQRG